MQHQLPPVTLQSQKTQFNNENPTNTILEIMENRKIKVSTGTRNGGTLASGLLAWTRLNSTKLSGLEGEGL